MIVYRLAKSQYADDISGKGAELSGGRWNNRGTSILYTAESRALALLEVAVRIDLSNIPEEYRIVSISIPEDKISSLSLSQLPDNWNSIPHNASTQQIGDNFIEKESHLALKVPSAIVEQEFNILINPEHSDSNVVKVDKIEPFPIDQRLTDN